MTKKSSGKRKNSRNLHNSAVKILTHLKEFVKQKFFRIFVFHKIPKSKHLTQSAPRVYIYLTFKAQAGDSTQAIANRVGRDTARFAGRSRQGGPNSPALFFVNHI
nr:MAG TPA: hypothetical protein [Caudoviricetes sp.]